MSVRTSVWSIAIPAVAAAAIGLWIVACSSNGSSNAPPPAQDSGAGADAATEAGDPTPEEQFRALQPELVATCGGTAGVCHVLGSFKSAPTWLGNPDPYVSAKNYPGILPASGDPNDSILLTQISHEGPSLQATPDLFGKVRAWISAEVGAEKLPETDPEPVTDGFNSFDLSMVAPGLMGAKLTFLAKTNNDILTLSSMKLYSPTASGLHVDSPFFIIVPSQGVVIADPVVNGFTGTLDIPAASSLDFYSGQMILLKWSSSSQLRVAFKQLSSVASTLDAGPSGACTAVPTFTSSAVPAFEASIALPEGGTGSCLGCHGGGDDVATNAMDLSAVGMDDAKACAQARNWINFMNKAQSTIVLNPQGLSNPQHPITSLAPSDPVVVGIQTWVTAEQ
jgi:hypothetical protein